MPENPYKSPEAEVEKRPTATPAPDTTLITFAKVAGAILATVMFTYLLFIARMMLFGDP